MALARPNIGDISSVNEMLAATAGTIDERNTADFPQDKRLHGDGRGTQTDARDREHQEAV